MKGFIAKTLAGMCLAGGLVASVGCHGLYNEVVDPCWPQRYNHVARREVCEAFAPQVQNGHILDQTVWNYYFETDPSGMGTDRLTPGGQQALVRLIRRRPAPDPVIYLATAEDIAYDRNHPEKFSELRNDLDRRRTQEVQKFINAQSAGRPIEFQVVVHDPAEVGLPAESARLEATRLQGNFQGVLRREVLGTGIQQ